ncbi:hypothetical protein A5634_15960 [Mycobacterium asiaticum]|uniref:HTH tetR-type domain-containing protein n=1 Tax=Mycobacterium asiaticum TaxID=1790 RepID=A0A1A3P8L4_MYCAS|nr:hypothetical protein A5634_15960 [Mycobacterium asiaticum]
MSNRSSRSYRSDLRQRQAEQTRSRVLAAAAELFAQHGYARTTLAKIAEAAGVSPETVQIHGPKAALMVAAAEYAGFGVAGEENILNLEVGRRLLEIEDRDEALEFLIAAQVEVHERTGRLALALFAGAGADAELDRYLTEFTASIDRNMERMLKVAQDKGWLRDDLPFDELLETTALISGVTTFLRITHRDGWSLVRYRDWCRRMLAENVFR